MCGIAGYFGKKNSIDFNISEIGTVMKNRGPNFFNYQNLKTGNNRLTLFHSRLSIIDLDNRSNQPFIDDDCILVFNGEIYNYLEIKELLKKKNHKFKTNSDTEVLLKSYKEYGIDCVKKFIGMWSFALWDKKKKKLFLSRDIFGEKPLFYFFDKKNFFFGSEIKYIQKLSKIKFDINDNYIFQNLFNGYKSLNKKNSTQFKNIYHLDPGTNLEINQDLQIKKKKYWSPKLKINKSLSQIDAIDHINHLLIKSLKFRMRSDVPIAFCLSGGIDSGYLASLAAKFFNKKISTFSCIDNDPRYDESENINAVIQDLKCDSTKIKIENLKKNFFDEIKELTDYHDGPIATMSYYIHSKITENIAKKNFKVSLSGVGSDEIFTGYYDHFLAFFQTIQSNKNFLDNVKSWEKNIKPILRNPNLMDHEHYLKNPKNRENVYENNFNISEYSNLSKNSKFIEKNFCKELLRNRMMNEMFHETVPVILKHDDLNSMYNSIENRSPFLDKELYEFSLTIPPEYLIKDGYQKYLLRQSSKKILIDKVRLDRKKKGFNASINSVIDFKNKRNIDKIFDSSSPINEYIDLKKLYEKVDFKFIPNHLSKLIFSIITTNYFLEKNL